MTMLTRLLGVRTAVEVGTFTGYSSLCIAQGLGDGGGCSAAT
jgi:caffeoyl-CoA O-methyltransferase